MNGVRIIKVASKLITSLIGIQKISTHVNYREAKFIIKINSEPYTLYFSCLTGELIEVINTKSCVNYLIEHFFYVPLDFDEYKYTDELFNIVRKIGNHKKNSPSIFEILTTTDCNARCFYCYEKQFAKQTMTNYVAQEVARFVLNNHDKNKSVKLKWYGGEPLYNINAIDIITSSLIKNNVRFCSSMITNGLLFSEEIMDKATNIWKLRNVRITIDGTESVYNKVKSYIGVNYNPFAQVIKNIELLIKQGILVTIRLNIEKYNIKDVKELLRFLTSLFSNIEINFEINLLNNTSSNKLIESSISVRQSIFYEITNIESYLFDLGYDVNFVKLKGLTVHYCSADSGNYMLVKPNGQIAYCSEDFDTKSYGSILKSSFFDVPNLNGTIHKRNSLCLDCPLFAQCRPSKLCPLRNSTCNSLQKEMILSDLHFSILQTYRESLL